MKNQSKIALALLTLFPVALHAGTVVNVDIARDQSGPLGGSARVLYTGVGAAADTGTIWNDFAISLTGAGDTIPGNYSQSDFLDSNGNATTVGLTLNSGWYRTVNGTSGNALQLERAFTLDDITVGLSTLTGLTAGGEYDLYLWASGNLATDYTVLGQSVNPTASATGAGFLKPTPTELGEGVQYVKFESVFADGLGHLQFSALGQTGGSAGGSLAGLQLVAVPEPSTSMILMSSFVALGFAIRRRR